MKKFSTIIFLGISLNFFAQETYIDVTTTLALKLYSDNLEKEQQKTVDEQTKLQKAQNWVATQMVVANKIQDKILKGLSEVSGTLQNGIQMKEIYQEIDYSLQYLDDVKKIVARHPQYSVFGVKATQRAYESLLKISTDAEDIIRSDETNLATAGDRYRLLENVQTNVITFKLWILTIKLNLERAENIGFWNAINPFEGYYNTDKEIVANIMDRYKLNF